MKKARKITTVMLALSIAISVFTINAAALWTTSFGTTVVTGSISRNTTSVVGSINITWGNEGIAFTNVTVTCTYRPPGGAPTITTSNSGSTSASVNYTGTFHSARANYSVTSASGVSRSGSDTI